MQPAYVKCYMLLLLVFFVRSTACLAQNVGGVIYTKSGAEVKGNINNVNEGRVLLSNQQMVNLDDLSIGIRENGDILVSSNDENGHKWLRNSSNEFHKIITLDKGIYAAERVEIISNKIGYQDHFNGRYLLLDTSEVALIIYNNGYHRVIGDLQIARECLSQIKDINDYSSREPASTIHLSKEEQDYFARKAENKTEALGIYLQYITDDSRNELEQDDAVKEALKLFYDNQRIVQVSSLNSEKINIFKIEKYLDHLRALKYERVELQWNQVAFVSEIRLDSNGEYKGVISVEQIFRGYNSDNQEIYRDVTQKNIEIIIKPLKQVVDGKQIKKWDVYLSDIGVKRTSSS